MKISTIGFIGGDMRTIHLIELLFSEKYNINVYGFDKHVFDNTEIKVHDNFYDVINNSDILIGPFPFSSNMETINSPFNSIEISIQDVLEAMDPKKHLIAGRIDYKLKSLFEENNVNAIDILAREEFAVLNAISISEGAIKIAIEELQYTLHNTDVLVLGFGRIGKILCKMLDGIGANVYCEARKYSDIAWIKAYGYKAIHLDELDKNINRFDAFFNTIPFIVFDKKQIDLMKSDSTFIDLASKPGGINVPYAKEKNINTILALSVSGRAALITTANHMKETILNIIKELI